MIKSYLQALTGSFYNPQTYRTAILGWPGFGGRYLGLLSGVLAVLLMISLLISLSMFEKHELPHFINQVPPVTLNDGVINVEGKQPVDIISSDKKIHITIDTTKSESELRDTKTQIGIGRDFAFLNLNNEYKVFYTKDLQAENIKINADTMHQAWRRNAPILKLIAFPLLWLGQFINVVVHCLLVALLSYVVTAFMTEEYDYITRMRFSAIALTPPSLIATLLNVVIGHQSTTVFVVLLALLYIFVMIHLIRKLPALATSPPESLS